MTTPTWQAATATYSALAGHVNQYLTTHATTYMWTGTLQESNTTDAGTHVSGNGTWLAQKITLSASQTTTGWAVLPIYSYTSSGSVLGPATLSLQADSSGAPSGTSLTSVTVYTEYAYAVSGGVAAQVPYPLPASGLTAGGAYWLVLSPAGNGTAHYAWEQSTATSGASTSTDGTTWTAQSYGLGYTVYDQSAVAPLLGTWEDSGARWTAMSYTSGQLTGIYEYTAGQSATGYATSSRTLSYSGTLLTGVA